MGKPKNVIHSYFVNDLELLLVLQVSNHFYLIHFWNTLLSEIYSQSALQTLSNSRLDQIDSVFGIYLDLVVNQNIQRNTWMVHNSK